MKPLIILGILAVIFLLLYLRLRPFIRMAKQMLGMARDVNRVMKQEAVPSSNQTGGTSDRLVRCNACETWIPASRAIKLRSSSAAYCSHACLELAAEGSKRKATG